MTAIMLSEIEELTSKKVHILYPTVSLAFSKSADHPENQWLVDVLIESDKSGSKRGATVELDFSDFLCVYFNSAEVKSDMAVEALKGTIEALIQL